MITTHQKTYKILLSILLFLLALIAVIFFTQYNSQKNIGSLIEANQTAAETFDVNNRLQEIVNFSEILERKCRNLYVTGKEEYANGASDTIGIINDHLALLTNTYQKNNPNNDLKVLTDLVREDMNYVSNFLVSHKNNNKTEEKRLIDSMMAENRSEVVYSAALQVQKSLENNLKKSLGESSSLSKKVLRLDKILSVVAILAIVILGTVIIRRLLAQVKLIDNLAREKERADNSVLIKEQFLANMSHEIRTPINAVVGFSNLLQKTSLQNDQKQFVDLIQKSGENLLTVVNDILDISKLEAGMMSISKNPFSIRDTCLSLEMMFYHKATENNILFSCQVDENIPDMLVGDAERLNQVLINLINNALKFTSEGEVSVAVTMREKTSDKVDLQFSVKDSGIGIPVDKQTAIFERFEQVDADSSRQYGGTGLGLAIVKKIINLQGGDIKVVSEPGKGAEFIFHIMYLYIDHPENINVLARQHTEEDIKFSNCKALVAEDNPTNQILLKYMFEQWNLDFDLAPNGIQALELMGKNPYDIVLMDIQMPVMDGYEAARRIRKEYSNHIPIIAMTAHVLPTEREKCLKSGMNDYISKPLKETELLRLLKKYLTFNSLKTGKTVMSKNPKNDFRYIDLAYLSSIFPANNKFMQEMMYQFREQYPSEINQLKSRLGDKDLEGIKSIAHHLKTTVSSLSIDTPLRIHLEKIEDYASRGDWQKIGQEVEALANKEEAVLSEVNTVITSC